MRARVTRALRGQIGVHDPAGAQLRQLAQAAVAHGRARGWNIDAEPQSLRIQTIDSFNYWLASQLPVAARVGGRLNVTEAARAALPARRAAHPHQRRGGPGAGRRHAAAL